MDENQEHQNQNNPANENDNQQQSVIQYVIEKKYETCLFVIRLYIIINGFVAVFPVFGIELSQNCYKRALLGSAAISALRLHQRIPRIQFNMEFAGQLVLEDSLHYLIYSILFLFLLGNTVTIILIPILLFSVIHAASYTKKIIDLGRRNNFLVEKLNQLVMKIVNQETQHQMLLFIAASEILVFVSVVFMVLSGQSSFLIPFFYYRFIQLRYSSRRNPYSRMVFNQLRHAIDFYSNHERCPAIGKRILSFIVSTTLRFAPGNTQ